MGMFELFRISAFSALTFFSAAPDTSEDCGMQVCVYGNGSWKAGERMNRKRRAKDAKTNRKRKSVALNVELDGDRGSVFVDGRYLATTGPHSERDIKPGKHEIEVRDAGQVITVGVLMISKNADSIAVVVHASR